MKPKDYKVLHDVIDVAIKKKDETTAARIREFNIRSFDRFVKGFAKSFAFYFVLAFLSSGYGTYAYFSDQPRMASFCAALTIVFFNIPILQGCLKARDWSERVRNFTPAAEAELRRREEEQEEDKEQKQLEKEKLERANRIRVRLANGKVGTIKKEDFDPTRMKKL